MSIKLNSSHLSVIEKIGKPNIAENDFYDKKSENWVYYKSGVPTEYVIVIKNGKVIKKYISVSP